MNSLRPILFFASLLGLLVVFAPAAAAQPAAFPAPSEWAAPAGFPAAPGDAFALAASLSLTDAIPPADAPVISEWHEIVLPGEAFTLSGIRFSLRGGDTRGTDTSVWLWADTPSGGTLRQCLLPRVEGDLLTAIVPDDIPYGLFLVWVENEAGVSTPVCLNRARPTWIGPVSSTGSPGSTKRVFGINLAHQRGSTTSHLFIQPAAGGALTPITPTAVGPYEVAFTLPDTTGDYRLWVHNGHGGALGWAGPLSLTVATPDARGSKVVEVSAGDGVADDTARIQSAIIQADTPSGARGTVQLAAGTYRIGGNVALGVRAGVRLRGAGSDPDTGPATILLIDTAAYFGINPGNDMEFESLLLRYFHAGMVTRLGQRNRWTNVRVDSVGHYLIRRLSADGTAVATTAGAPAFGTHIDANAADARFFNPGAIVVSPDGTLFVADTGNHVIRRITPDGTVSTYAGAPGVFGTANGTAAEARFYQPSGLALASDGALYVADTGNHAIRLIAVDGTVSTLAGSPGRSGAADGPALSALFRLPEAVTLAPDGTLFVADTENHAIRALSADRGTVSTVAGSLGTSGAVDAVGGAARFRYPGGLALASDGSLYVADTFSHTLRRVAPDGAVTTIAGLESVRGAQDGPSLNATFDRPRGLAFTADGALLIADSKNKRIRRLSSDQTTVSTLAGSDRLGAADGPTEEATLAEPQSLAVAADGTVHFTTSGLPRARVDVGHGAEIRNCVIQGELYLNASSNLWIHDNLFLGAPYNTSEGVLAEIFVNNEIVIENNVARTPAWPVGPGGRRDYESFLSRRQQEQTFFAMRLYSGRTGSRRHITRNTTRDMARGHADSNKGEQILLHDNDLGRFAQVAAATASTVTLRDDGLIDGVAPVVDEKTPLAATREGWNGLYAAVIRGTGIGQMRRIARSDGGIVTLEQPWRVPPAPDSVVVITHGYADNLIVGNNLAGFPEGMTGESASASTGVQLDANAFKCFVEGNTSTRTFALTRLDGKQASPSFWNEFRAERGADLLRAGFVSFSRGSGASVGTSLLGNNTSARA